MQVGDAKVRPEYSTDGGFEEETAHQNRGSAGRQVTTRRRIPHHQQEFSRVQGPAQDLLQDLAQIPQDVAPGKSQPEDQGVKD